MPNFEYTRIPDYIIDILWGVNESNDLLHNLRYLGEDILGDPQENGGIPRLTLDNGATDGGTVYFNGGTSEYLQCNADGDQLTVQGFDLVVPSPYIIKGSKAILQFPGGVYNSTAFLGSRNGDELGFVMPFDGSILGYSICVYSTSGSQVNKVIMYNRSSNIEPSDDWETITTVSNTQVSLEKLFDRNEYTFSEGDDLNIGVQRTSGSANVEIRGTLEVTIDV